MKYPLLTKIFTTFIFIPWILIFVYLGPVWKLLIYDFNIILEHDSLFTIVNISIYDPLVISTTFFFIGITVAQVIMGWKDYKENKISLPMVFFQIFFGGTFIWLPWFAGKIKKLFSFSSYIFTIEWNAKLSYKKIGTITTWVIIVLPLMIAPFLMPMPIEQHSPKYDITFSLDPSDPNVLYIFTDGLSPISIDKYVGEKREADVLSGFMGFPNTVSSGTKTISGIAGSLAGEDRTMIAYPEGATQSKQELFEIYDEDNTTNRYFINPITILSPQDNVGLATGNWKYTEEIFDNTSVVNWTAARETAFENSDYGNTHHTNNMKYIGYKSTEGEASTTFLYDDILHFPFVSSSDGKFSRFATEESTYNGLFSNLDFLFNEMKKIDNGVTNAFDNTTIIITSDHGSHDYYAPVASDPGKSFITKSYVKFPDFSGDYKEMNDYSLWNPHIKNIWESHNEGEFNTLEEMSFWVSNNENFKIDRTHFVALNKDSYYEDYSGLYITLDSGYDYSYEVIYKNQEIFNVSEARSTIGPEALLGEVRWK